MENVMTYAERRVYHFKNMKGVGKFLYYTGTARVYADVQGPGIAPELVFRWWHPFAWITVLLSLLAVFFIHGKKGVCELFAEGSIQFRVSSYYREHPDELEWL